MTVIVSGTFNVILLVLIVVTIGYLLIAIENVLRTSNILLSSVVKGNLFSIVSNNYPTSINTL